MSEDQLTTLLRAIGLHYTAQTLPDLIARATKQRASPRAIIELFAKAEDVDRKRKSLERRSRRSRVGHLTSMADFDCWFKRGRGWRAGGEARIARLKHHFGMARSSNTC